MAIYTRVDRQDVSLEEAELDVATADFTEWKCDTCEYRCIGLRAIGEHVIEYHGEGSVTEVELVN